jgi:DNA-binding Xre family transcriptional regulator
MLEPWHYIALLGAVVAVGALSISSKKASGPPVQSMNNMETALEQFMENMEKDNEDLLQLVAKSQADIKEEGERKDVRIAALEKRCEALDLQLQDTLDKLARTTASPLNGAPIAVAEIYARPSSTDTIDRSQAATQPQSIVSRYSELFRLYEEGKSIEAIAKKLGMNKGEVQLIIGLAKQEGAAHV